MNKLQSKDGAHSKALEATQFWDANKDPNSEKALLWLVVTFFYIYIDNVMFSKKILNVVNASAFVLA